MGLGMRRVHMSIKLPVLIAPSKSFPWPTLRLAPYDISRYLGGCVAAGIGYFLGGKADDGGRPLDAWPPRYSHIDCSGWVRAALAFATQGALVIPDGSVNQREWCEGHGLKRSNYAALLRRDFVIRIAFIRATRTEHIGHVYLCYNGRTWESYGGHGPGSRSVLVHVLKALTSDVFVLTAPFPNSPASAGGVVEQEGRPIG